MKVWGILVLLVGLSIARTAPVHEGDIRTLVFTKGGYTQGLRFGGEPHMKHMGGPSDDFHQIVCHNQGRNGPDSYAWRCEAPPSARARLGNFEVVWESYPQGASTVYPGSAVLEYHTLAPVRQAPQTTYHTQVKTERPAYTQTIREEKAISTNDSSSAAGFLATFVFLVIMLILIIVCVVGASHVHHTPPVVVSGGGGTPGTTHVHVAPARSDGGWWDGWWWGRMSARTQVIHTSPPIHTERTTTIIREPEPAPQSSVSYGTSRRREESPVSSSSSSSWLNTSDSTDTFFSSSSGGSTSYGSSRKR